MVVIRSQITFCVFVKPDVTLCFCTLILTTIPRKSSKKVIHRHRTRYLFLHRFPGAVLTAAATLAMSVIQRSEGGIRAPILEATRAALSWQYSRITGGVIW